MYAMGWATLGGVLLSQIEIANFFGRGSRFRRSLLQDLLLYAMIKVLSPCIIDIEMDMITANSRL